MSEDNSLSLGFDGVRYVLRSEVNGVVRTARLAAGAHTNAEHDAVVASLKLAYPVLRQWSLDAQDAFNTWPQKTNAQKDATQREVIRRLGVFFDRFADYLLASNTDA